MKIFQLKVSGTGITGDEFVYSDAVLKSDCDALAAALKVVQDTSIAHAGKQNDRIRSLESDKADLVRVLGVADERIKALEEVVKRRENLLRNIAAEDPNWSVAILNILDAPQMETSSEWHDSHSMRPSREGKTFRVVCDRCGWTDFDDYSKSYLMRECTVPKQETTQL